MIQNVFADYLAAGASPASAAQLSSQLGAQMPFESLALSHFAASGPSWLEMTEPLYDRKRVYLGPLPPACDVGTLWFDTCELSLAMLLPPHFDPEEGDEDAPDAHLRLQQQSVWFALNPVTRFQYGAFLDLAPINKTAFDRTQPLKGDPFGAVTHVSYFQAGAYVGWFGKVPANRFDWLAALDFQLTPWRVPEREFGGSSPLDDDDCVVVSAVTIHTDPEDTEDNRGLDHRMIYPKNAILPDVTFRSTVPVVFGIRSEDVPSGEGIWRLGGRYRRT